MEPPSKRESNEIVDGGNVVIQDLRNEKALLLKQVSESQTLLYDMELQINKSRGQVLNLTKLLKEQEQFFKDVMEENRLHKSREHTIKS